MASETETLLSDEYEQRRNTLRLRDRAFAGIASNSELDALAAAEIELAKREDARVAAEAQSGSQGRVITTEGETFLLGPDSTGLAVDVALRMAQVPTSIYHLFDRAETPLLAGTIENRRPKDIRRLRVVSHIDGYSAMAVETLEIRPNKSAEFNQLPTLFPERTRDVVELTRATVNILIEEIGGTGLELHRTDPIWLLPRTTAPFAVRDPATGRYRDLSRYFGAYVTPSDPVVMKFLMGPVAEAHPEHKLVSYQEGQPAVTAQIKAIFDALHAQGLRYVNSTVSYSPEDGIATQRVRLPADSLAGNGANCIDGTVLVASLIEAASMNAALVIVPNHAFVGWETGSGTGTWDYLETTLIGSSDFETAVTEGRKKAALYQKVANQIGDPGRFRRWSIRELRGQRITPLQ